MSLRPFAVLALSVLFGAYSVQAQEEQTEKTEKVEKTEKIEKAEKTSPKTKEKKEKKSESEKASSDWPNWRGPTFDGKSPLKGFRTDWSGGLKKLWATDILTDKTKDGDAWSSPSIKGDKLVVMGRQGSKDVVYCFDAEKGDLIWQKDYEAPGKSDSYGCGPRGTPTIEGDKIYTFGRMGNLACFDLADGKMNWNLDVKTEGGKPPGWNWACSPFVYKDTVIVQAGGDALVLAADKKTGKVAWKNQKGLCGYATPVLAKIGGKEQLLIFAGQELFGLDPKNGDKFWNVPWKSGCDVNAACPVFDGNFIFITSGYNTGCALVEADAKSAKFAWSMRSDQGDKKAGPIVSHHSDPILVDGYVYGYSGQSMDNQALKCVEFKTGKEKWSAGNEVGWGTMIYLDGYLLCQSNKGDLYLVEAKPDAFKKVTEFKGANPGSPVWTIPAIANGKLYCRYKERLTAYDLMK